MHTELSWASFFGVTPVAAWKLAEAKFFLGKFQEAFDMMRAGIMWGQPPAQIMAAFYGSAFLSAGRSVTFALQNEDKETYDARFPMWAAKLSAADQEIFALMNKKRAEEVHCSGAKTIIIDELVVETPTIPGYAVIGVPYFKLKTGKIPVCDACIRYVNLLESLVESTVTPSRP